MIPSPLVFYRYSYVLFVAAKLSVSIYVASLVLTLRLQLIITCQWGIGEDVTDIDSNAVLSL